MRTLWFLIPLLAAACAAETSKTPSPEGQEPAPVVARDSFWQGPVETELQQFAKEACDCMKTVMKGAGVHFPALFSTDPEKMNADKTLLQVPEFEKKYAAALTELEKLTQLLPEQFPCIDELARRQAEKNIKPEEVSQISRSQCTLMKYF